MHEITGDKDFVKSILKDTIAQLDESRPKSKKSGVKAMSLSGKLAKQAPESEDIAAALQQGLDWIDAKKRVSGASLNKSVVPGERAVDTRYAPRNQVIALVQSAMDEYLDKTVGPAPQASPARRGKKTAKALSTKHGAKGDATRTAFYQAIKVKKPGKTTKAVDVFIELGNLDPRWITVVTEKAKLLFKGKHGFITHTSISDFRFRMENETTVAIVGDWGGGNMAAQAVADQIKKLNPKHVIHLGDVYYSGTMKEVKERFLKFWPTPKSPGLSFALNSNHEMYSGGYGYFDLTLKRFKQPASYFSLINDHWRLIGLDTGYDDHDLKDPQVAWLKGQVTSSQKNILLSHHQLFSAYEQTDASKLRGKVQGLLDRVYGWIWGHEHLAVVYKKHDGIKGVCLGNGCFPFKLPTRAPTLSVKWLDKHQGSDPDYPGGHTFALLHLRGPRIDIHFIDHLGNIGHKETWE